MRITCHTSERLKEQSSSKDCGRSSVCVYPKIHCSTVYNSQDTEQPRCPSADTGMRKLWYIYTAEYCSVIKKNACELVLIRCMKLVPNIQSEVSQKEKHPYSILAHIYGI